MIFHAIKIIAQELNTHLDSLTTEADDTVVLKNIAFHEVDRETEVKDKIAISLVRLEQEASLRNQKAYSRDSNNNKILYHNPPITVNAYILFTFNSWNYEHALIYLSRTVKFFQSKTIFTHRDVQAVTGIPEDETLKDFKLILELYSPSFEETNHLWSVLGGKQIPFVVYKMKVLDLEFLRIKEERSVIKEILINDKSTAI